MNGLAQGGGVVVDVDGLQKPAAAKAVIVKAKQYIATMHLLRKPCTHVTLHGAQYDAVLSAVRKSRDDKSPEVCGLQLAGVPLDRAA